jgi:hypothetical protein
VGRAFHTLTLEGRNEYASRYAVGGPINEKTGKQFGPGTKAFAEWAERQNKEVLTLDQAELVERMADAIRVHEAASMLLSEGVAENVVRTEYLGLPCQIRMDWLHPEQGIADLKSADQLDYFEADARRYGYLHQMAFYRAVLAHAAGVRPTDIPVHVIAAEKAEPYRAGVWSVTNDILAICQAENEHAISRLHDAERTGIWLTGYEEIRSFNCL